MKHSLAYIFPFLLAFIATSGIIYILNLQYNDIFRLDFSPAKPVPQAKVEIKFKDDNIASNFSELKSYIDYQFKDELLDSLKSIYANNGKVDTVVSIAYKDSSLLDSLKQLNDELKKAGEREKSIMEAKLKAQAEKVKNENKPDSTYLAWMKKTAKLYESMDPRQAAKIIQKYSDNIARDILYTMKKKKAAEVLALLNPEEATRITRVQ